MTQVRNHVSQDHMTLLHSGASYSCNICKDTGWQLTEHGTYKRCGCFEKDYFKRLWNNFGVNAEEAKKLNEYSAYDNVTSTAKEKAENYIKSFDEIRLTRGNSYGLFGQAGAGKSHIAIAIGAELLNKNIKVIYMPYLEATRELKSNVLDDKYYTKLISHYKQAEALVIDDLFKDKVRNGELIKGACITESDMKHIYPILNYRYFNNLPTIFSTECTPTILDWMDEALAGRILESCGDNIVIFKGKQYNYRMRKFIKK